MLKVRSYDLALCYPMAAHLNCLQVPSRGQFRGQNSSALLLQYVENQRHHQLPTHI